jgi:predicted dehydrogenase
MANWGIIGIGRIARKFISAVQHSQSERIVALASRDAAKATAAAGELGIARGYGSYQELLADSAVECVYLALPNALHAEWSIAAVEAGKHVLCEKPLATSEAEARAMFEAARTHNVWLMEAFMYRFHPQTLLVQQLISEGVLGTPKLVRASFGFAVSDAANVRLSAELAGGALMDVGCYCVNAARWAVGERPARVLAAARWAASGVDETLAATLEYANGVVAQIACSLAVSRHHYLQIVGDAGLIELDQPFTLLPDRPSTVRLQRGTTDQHSERITVDAADHFRLEAEGFAALIAAGHQNDGNLPSMPLVETLDNAATITALLDSARSGLSVAV